MKLYFKFIKFLLFIIFHFLFLSINSNLSFIYPTAITLSDGNILVVEKNGIYICDPTFSNILSREFIFNDEDQIKNKDELSKVILKRKTPQIIGLINFKIYIFDYDGKLLYNSFSKLIDDSNIQYCALIPLSFQNNALYYIIGYFDSYNFLNLIYYKYNKSDNTNIYITSKIDARFRMEDSDYSYSFQNKGLSCEYMDEYSDNAFSILVCFYIIISDNIEYLIEGFYSLTTDSLENYYYISSDYYNVQNPKFIKSDKTYNNKKALICLVSSDNKATCYKFLISGDVGYFYSSASIKKKCRDEIYGMNVRYLFETKEVVFSCSDSDGSIQAAIYSEELSTPESSFKQFISCESIYGYSVLYSNNKSDYYVVSDVKCDGNENPFTLLITSTGK